MRAYEPLFFRCSPKISARWCSAPIVGKNPTCRFGASALPIRTDISPLLSWKSTASSDCRAIIPGLSVSEGTSLGPYLLNSRSAQAEWGKCTAQWIHAAAYSLGHGLCVPTNVVLNSLKREGRDRKGKIPGSLSQTLAVPPTLCRGHAFYVLGLVPQLTSWSPPISCLRMDHIFTSAMDSRTHSVSDSSRRPAFTYLPHQPYVATTALLSNRPEGRRRWPTRTSPTTSPNVGR